MQTHWLVTKLKIGILSYRSAPFGGGQGIYVRDISQALASLGHTVDVISGEPYPELYSGVRLIKLPGMNLFETFSFKDRLKKFVTNPINLINIQEFVSTLLHRFCLPCKKPQNNTKDINLSKPERVHVNKGKDYCCN